MKSLPAGVQYLPNYLSAGLQKDLISEIRDIVQRAPLYTPQMPRTGKPMSVKMTNCGSLGWVTDKHLGYRYQKDHPVTQNPWPEIPTQLRNLWQELANYSYPLEACLINFYDDTAKMGMHQDRDEQDLKAPVISISLGDDCLFRVGGIKRGGPTKSFRLQSGDVIVLGGEARLAFHGVEKIFPGTSMLLKGSGRINLTLRRVTIPV